MRSANQQVGIRTRTATNRAGARRLASKANATVYFSWGLLGDCDANAGTISSVPVDDGLETQIIGAADTFTVSPDGALVYYRSAY
jgi:hypothetical protein